MQCSWNMSILTKRASDLVSVRKLDSLLRLKNFIFLQSALPTRGKSLISENKNQKSWKKSKKSSKSRDFLITYTFYHAHLSYEMIYRSCKKTLKSREKDHTMFKYRGLFRSDLPLAYWYNIKHTFRLKPSCRC